MLLISKRDEQKQRRRTEDGSRSSPVKTRVIDTVHIARVLVTYHTLTGVAWRCKDQKRAPRGVQKVVVRMRLRPQPTLLLHGKKQMQLIRSIARSSSCYAAILQVVGCGCATVRYVEVATARTVWLRSHRTQGRGHAVQQRTLGEILEILLIHRNMELLWML